MTEEQTTKAILTYLKENGWEIVSFDFPQSGTGIMLHHDSLPAEKNKKGFIPDIVAVKESICLFFENKNRFYYQDFLKINSLITNNTYNNSIDKLLNSYQVTKIYYGIGLPTVTYSQQSRKFSSLVDFILGVNGDGTIQTLYSVDSLLFLPSSDTF